MKSEKQQPERGPDDRDEPDRARSQQPDRDPNANREKRGSPKRPLSDQHLDVPREADGK